MLVSPLNNYWCIIAVVVIVNATLLFSNYRPQKHRVMVFYNNDSEERQPKQPGEPETSTNRIQHHNRISTTLHETTHDAWQRIHSQTMAAAPEQQQQQHPLLDFVKLWQERESVAVATQWEQERRNNNFNIDNDEDCDIGFRKEHEHLHICYNSQARSMPPQLGPVLVRALLQGYFSRGDNNNCRVHDIALLDLHQHHQNTTASSTPSRAPTCLLMLDDTLPWAQEGDHVWGASLLLPQQQQHKALSTQRQSSTLLNHLPSHLILHATRGPQSARLWNEHQRQTRHEYERPLATAQMGDPLYLIPFLFPHLARPKTLAQPQPIFCLVTQHDAQAARRGSKPNVIHVPLHDDWVSMVSTLANNCTHVASSSLDALVLAEAMGKPMLWLDDAATARSKRNQDPRYVSHVDFFQSVGRNDLTQPTAKVASLTDTSRYTKPQSLEQRTARALQFAGSFPFHLFERRKPVSFATTSALENDNKLAAATRQPSTSRHNNKHVPVASGPFANQRTLVIAGGNLRGGELAWQSLKENVLDVNPNTDLALMIGETRPEYQNSSLFGLAKYTWTFDEYDDWGQAVDTINGTAWRDEILPRLSPDSQILGAVDYANFRQQGSATIVYMWRYWLSQKVMELGLLDQYDRFIITRTDHFYICPHDLSWFDTNNYLYLPVGEDYEGFEDRHYIVGRQFVLAALDVLPHLLRHPDDYDVEPHIFANRHSNPEKMLRRRWTVGHMLPYVRRFARSMFTCMQPGDGSRWSKGKTLVREGVWIKYKKEYFRARQGCNASYWWPGLLMK